MGLFEEAQKEVEDIVTQYKSGPAVPSPEGKAGPSLFELAQQDVEQIVNAPVSRSAVGEMFTAFERGTVSGVPKAGGQAAQYLGRQLNMPSITDVGKSLEEIGIEQGLRKDLQPSADLAQRPVVRTLAGVSESLPLSIVPVAAGAVGTAMGGPVVGGAVAASTALPLFGGSSAEETRRKVLAAGKPEAEAESAAGKVFWVQGSLDTAQTLLSGALMRVLGKPVLGAGALTAKEVLTRVANPKHLKTFTKEFGKIATAEAATEAGQDVATQMIEERAGVKSDRTLAETGTESAIGGALMASFFGALGIPIRISQANQHSRLLSALSDPKTSLSRRTAAAEAIGEQIEKVDPEKAKNWRENAAVAIDNRIPIELNESFLGSARELKDRIQGLSMRGEPYGGPSSPYRTPYPTPNTPPLLPPGDGSAAFGQSTFGPGVSPDATGSREPIAALPSITDIPMSRASDLTEEEIEGEVLPVNRAGIGAPDGPAILEGESTVVTERIPGEARRGLPAPAKREIPTEGAGRNLADSMGLKFEGIQDDVYGNPAYYVIADPETSSTHFFTTDDTQEKIQKKLESSRELFAKTGEPEVEPTTTTVDTKKYPVSEVPVAFIHLSEDVPNFKEDANTTTGVVEGQELRGGQYERIGTAPIVLWKRKSGRLEVITGRHRLDLARRTKEKTIPAQIVRETEGFTKDMALTFDAESNIRDGQGRTEDYAHYFKNSPQLDEATARSRGLLDRAKGKAGFDLGKHASDDLYTLWKNGKINEDQALAIVRAAPDNAQAQEIGAKYALEHKSAAFIQNIVRVALLGSERTGGSLDLFGHDDAALKEAEAQAKRAVAFQRELKDQIAAVSGASKRPEAARKLGVDVKDPESVRAKIVELKAEAARWENWPAHPDLVAKVREAVQEIIDNLSEERANIISQIAEQGGPDFLAKKEPEFSLEAEEEAVAQGPNDIQEDMDLNLRGDALRAPDRPSGPQGLTPMEQQAIDDEDRRRQEGLNFSTAEPGQQGYAKSSVRQHSTLWGNYAPREQEAIKRVERATGVTVNPAMNVSRAVQNIVDTMEKFTGIRILLVQGELPFKGVLSERGIMLVRADIEAADVLSQIIAHEAFHNVEHVAKVMPQMVAEFSKFQNTIREVVGDGPVRAYMEFENKRRMRLNELYGSSMPMLDMEGTWSEYGAHIMGDTMRDPLFFQRLYEKNRSVFERFVDYILAALKKLGIISKTSVDSNYYTPEMARSLVLASSDLWAKYLEVQNEGGIIPESGMEARFSSETENGTWIYKSDDDTLRQLLIKDNIYTMERHDDGSVEISWRNNARDGKKHGRSFPAVVSGRKRPIFSSYEMALDAIRKEYNAVPYSTSGLSREDYSSLMDELKKSQGDQTKAWPHLQTLGKSIYDNGATTYQKFVEGMKKTLGDLWESFKNVMIKLYQSIKQNSPITLAWDEYRGKPETGKMGAQVNAPQPDPTAGDPFAKKIESDLTSGKRSTPEEIRAAGFTTEQAGQYDRLYDNLKGADQRAHFEGRRKRDMLKGMGEEVDRFAGIISTRLKNINESIKYRLRQYQSDLLQNQHRDNLEAYDFVDKFKVLPMEDGYALSEALLNGDVAEADRIATKHNMLKELNRVRALFIHTRGRAQDAGLRMGVIENYWARIVKDPEGLLSALRGTEEWSAIDNAIYQAESKGPISDAEKAAIADLILRGHPAAGAIPLTRTSHLKERKFRTIPKQYLKYYMSADQSVISYIRSMNNTIEAARFFGKGRFTVDPESVTEQEIEDSIGDYVLKLKESKQISGKDELPLKEMLAAIFRPAVAGPFAQMYKNMTYLQLLTQITPAITQLADFALIAEQVGYWGALKGYAKAIRGKSGIKLADLGVDRVMAEFDGTATGLSKMLDKALKWTGFEAVDRMGKEGFLNAQMDKFVKDARAGDEKLAAFVNVVFNGDDVKSAQVLADLREGKKTDDTMFLLFNKLSDLQPITALEVPEAYLKAKTGKIFYALKTYQLKLLDVYRNDFWNIVVKDKGTRAEKIEAYQRMLRLTTALVAMGFTTDWIKDWLLGRKSDPSDMAVDNLLRLGGISKYQLSRAREEGLGQAMLAQFAPPLGFMDATAKDVDELVRKGELEKGSRITGFIPVVGKGYYWWFGRGASIKQEKEQKQEKEDKEKTRLGSRYEAVAEWKDKRKNILDNIKSAKTADDSRKARIEAIKFNAGLNSSPASGEVSIISADIINKPLNAA